MHTGGRNGNLMGWIENKIGIKECLRDWNKERMSNAKFDSWWDGHISIRDANNKLIQTVKKPE